jgi:hypothetical protein
LSSPEATAWDPGRRDIFVRGPGGGIYDRAWTSSGGWGTYQGLPAVVLSGPAATSVGPGRLQLFARGSIGLVADSYNGGWSGWQNFSGIPPTPPAPAPAPVAPAPPPSRSELRLRAGFGCIPTGGRVPVRLRVHQRNGRRKPRVIRVVFFLDGGKRRRVDRHKPYRTRLRVTFERGTRHRVHARIFFRRQGSRRVHRKTVSKRFMMCP